MGKVAVITLSGGENYGNSLQNYAVQETVRELGLDAETIVNTTAFGRALPQAQKVNKLTFKYVRMYLRNKLNYNYNIKNSGKGILKTLLFCNKNKEQLNAVKNLRKKGFEEFRQKYINWAENNIDINKLWMAEQTEKYDFFVSGSDQVWNPTYPSTSSINFLQFAPEYKRVTFSPSFGINEIPDVLRDDYSKWLKEIPHLSVREERGREIIKELCGRDAKVLCDPTMCLSKEKWLSVAQKPEFDTSFPYILTYFLGDRTKEYDRYIEKIAKEHGLKIINLYDVLDLEHYATSPQELIYLINNAKLVCTDSFHGTVFSIIMKTDFVTFPRVESGKSMHSRIDTLLSSFNLRDRNYDALSQEKLFRTDFSASDNLLQQKKDEVISFLQKAFSAPKKPQEEKAVKTTVLDIKENCCGCSACSEACPVNCIAMVSDTEGFKYPEIDRDRCVDCKRCENICPAVNKTSPEKQIGEHCFVAYSLDNAVRKNSSSGGIFYHLAKKIINEGGVVFGAAVDGYSVKHTFAENEEQIKQFMGSKYVQSDMGDCYKSAKDFLESGKKVLFSGTPCQIKGLYAFLGKKAYPNLITQDLICHGVPSPKVWESYIGHKTKAENPQISFRDKFFGWHYFSLKIKDKSKVYRKNLEEDWYLKLFLDNTILRPSCHNCKAKQEGSSADITLADCWGPHKVCPDVRDTDKGLSLVLVNSQKGNDFWSELSAHNVLFSKEVESGKAIASQSAISQSANMNAKRALFFESLNKMSFGELYKSWYRKSLVRTVKQKIVYLKMKVKIFITR